MTIDKPFVNWHLSSPRNDFFRSAPVRWIGLVLLTMICTGCGGSSVPLVRVTGRVLLDGEPVTDAKVVFHPEAGGRPSLGLTDGEGAYELTYVEQQRGAIPGRHKVTISTFVEPDGDSSDPDLQSGRPESVPAEFNTRSTLQADVPAARRTEVDFDLTRPDSTASSP